MIGSWYKGNGMFRSVSADVSWGEVRVIMTAAKEAKISQELSEIYERAINWFSSLKTLSNKINLIFA